MKAGIDIGSTLIKAAVPAVGGTKYFSTKDMSKETLVEKLQGMGVSRVNVTGIGLYDLPFKFARAMGDPVASEIVTQLRGTQYLLKSWCHADAREVPILSPQYGFCLISVGTGASFTNVVGNWHQHLPYGSCFAGGWLSRIANHVFTDRNTYSNNETTLRTLDGFAQLAFERGIPSTDLLLKDVMRIPDEQLGKIVIASCGKLPPPYPVKDLTSVAYSLINAVAISLFDKLLMYRHFNEVRTDNVVLIGSTASLVSLQMAFRRLALPHGITTWVPPHAEYAGAIGALLALDDEFIATADVTEKPRKALAALKATAAKSVPTSFHFAHH